MNRKTLPSPSDFYLNTGLYESYIFEEKDLTSIFHILFYEGTIDAHCKYCEKESILKSIDNFPEVGYDRRGENLSQYRKMKTPDLRISFYEIIQQFFLKEFSCTRCNHSFQFHFEVNLDFDPNELKEFLLIQKIGQNCSISDFQNHDIKKYRKVLGNFYNEFSKGVGLFSHGIGVGAFIYLRRIIEQFILAPAKAQALTDGKISEEEFIGKKVKEKITLLRDYIPQFLIENKEIYSILSKGIHELSEEECKQMFPILKTAIELILDDIKAKQEQEKKRNELSREINNLNQKHQ